MYARVSLVEKTIWDIMIQDMMVTDLLARCTKQCALTVRKNAKCHSSHLATGQFTAEIATKVEGNKFFCP